MQVAHSINMQVVHWVDTECRYILNFKKISKANEPLVCTIVMCGTIVEVLEMCMQV